MSFNKNTINMSDIDRIETVLIILKEPYTIEKIDTVKGLGLNDDIDGVDAQHSLFKLCFRDKVVIDRMERTMDCDCDDCIVSYVIDKDQMPEVWHNEIYMHDDDYMCDSNCSCKINLVTNQPPQQLELL